MLQMGNVPAVASVLTNPPVLKRELQRRPSQDNPLDFYNIRRDMPQKGGLWLGAVALLEDNKRLTSLGNITAILGSQQNQVEAYMRALELEGLVESMTEQVFPLIGTEVPRGTRLVMVQRRVLGSIVPVHYVSDRGRTVLHAYEATTEE